MAITVPDEMAYYSERDAQAERLLCWIPPQQYSEVALDDQALQRLRENYPSGLEVRVDPKELEAEGIKLPVDPEDLTRTYRELRDRRVLHESGMIIGATLQHSAKEVKRGASLDSLVGAARERPPRPVRRIAELPRMKGDEEPSGVFRRLSVRQRTMRK